MFLAASDPSRPREAGSLCPSRQPDLGDGPVLALELESQLGELGLTGREQEIHAHPASVGVALNHRRAELSCGGAQGCSRKIAKPAEGRTDKVDGIVDRTILAFGSIGETRRSAVHRHAISPYVIGPGETVAEGVGLILGERSERLPVGDNVVVDLLLARDFHKVDAALAPRPMRLDPSAWPALVVGFEVVEIKKAP